MSHFIQARRRNIEAQFQAHAVASVPPPREPNIVELKAILCDPRNVDEYRPPMPPRIEEAEASLLQALRGNGRARPADAATAEAKAFAALTAGLSAERVAEIQEAARRDRLSPLRWAFAVDGRAWPIKEADPATRAERTADQPPAPTTESDDGRPTSRPRRPLFGRPMKPQPPAA